jgi:serine palmitoyltransferase
VHESFAMKHPDVRDLEQVLREAISHGQPSTQTNGDVDRKYKPWGKIIIMVEGIYSMEGDMCALKQIVELKRKYKVRECMEFRTDRMAKSFILPF